MHRESWRNRRNDHTSRGWSNLHILFMKWIYSNGEPLIYIQLDISAEHTSSKIQDLTFEQLCHNSAIVFIIEDNVDVLIRQANSMEQLNGPLTIRYPVPSSLPRRHNLHPKMTTWSWYRNMTNRRRAARKKLERIISYSLHTLELGRWQTRAMT